MEDGIKHWKSLKIGIFKIEVFRFSVQSDLMWDNLTSPWLKLISKLYKGSLK